MKHIHVTILAIGALGFIFSAVMLNPFILIISVVFVFVGLKKLNN